MSRDGTESALVETQIVLSLYRFSLRATDELSLPEYWGSTLRGGFGHVFRRIACPARSGEGCPIPYQCPYHLIFETSPPPEAQALRNLDEIPRPFVIAPPSPVTARGEPALSPVERPSRTTGGRHPPGAELSFGLSLIGRAIDFLPYFVVAFRELGLDGLGRGRGRFCLRQIDGIDVLSGEAHPVYRDEDHLVRSLDRRVSLAACRARARQCNGRLTVRFLTPTRLKHNGQLAERPEFHVLFRALLRRLSSLALFHCDVRLDVDYRGLIAEAEQVKLTSNNTEWHDWQRYSSRQGQRMDFGGLIGEASYEGEFSAFLPYLLFGQWTHVGKNATFGLGRYLLRTGMELL